MRRRALSHACRIAASISLLAACVAAQDAKPRPPAKREFKHKAKIESSYDRFKDETRVRLEPKRVLGGALEDIKMGASFSYTGRKASAPEHVSMFFRTSTREWRFLNETQRELIALADGERLPLGTLERASNVAPGGWVSEILGTDVPYETFLKIANAKKVEMKLGRYEFTLKEEHLEALRDLASRAVQ